VYLPPSNIKAAAKNLGVGGVFGMLGFILSLRNY